jgi:hypothetical protein
MKKLAIAVCAATMLLAACGSSSKSSDSSGNKSTTTSAGGGGGSNEFSALVAKAKTANYKVTYKTEDSSSTVTIAQDGKGKISVTTADSFTTTDGSSTVRCDGTTSSAKCTELGSAGAGAVSAATSFVMGAYAALGGLNASALGGDSSSQTIAGTDATCVTISAANAGALGSALSKLAGSPSATTCVQKDTGVLLRYTATSGDTTKTFFEATEYGESSPSDFEPPSTPVTTPSIPNITLPGGITIPSIPGVNP